MNKFEYYINSKNLINKNIKNQLLSVKITIIHNNTSSEYKGIFKSEIIELNTDVLFIENEKYSFIISIVALGKQILKEKYDFIYKNEEFLIQDEQINIKITNNNMRNEIKRINKVSLHNYCEYNYRINPLAIVRQESSNTITIFLNGNIYIIKGILMKIVNEIVHIKNFNKLIEENNKLRDIDILISKGCIICYE